MVGEFGGYDYIRTARWEGTEHKNRPTHGDDAPDFRVFEAELVDVFAQVVDELLEKAQAVLHLGAAAAHEAAAPGRRWLDSSLPVGFRTPADAPQRPLRRPWARVVPAATGLVRYGAVNNCGSEMRQALV